MISIHLILVYCFVVLANHRKAAAMIIFQILNKAMNTSKVFKLNFIYKIDI